MDLNILKDKNSHPRDSRIKFDSENHIYSVDDNNNYSSVTQLISNFFPRFDKDYWANSEILLEIANLFNHKYFLIHEEEYLIFHRKLFEELRKNFISTYHFNNMDGLFVMSSKTQKK